LDETNLQHAVTWQILLRFFFPSLAGLIVTLLAYAVYRWKVAFDKREMQSLRPDIMSTKMEALAAEKKALRDNNRNAAKPPVQKEQPPEPEPKSGTEDGGDVLSF
jgi:polyhydroxyalkanoate synthesis regulator protein